MEKFNENSDHELLIKQTDDLNKLALVMHTMTTEMILLRKDYEIQMKQQTQSLQKIARAAELWTALVIIGLIVSCVLFIFSYSILGVGAFSIFERLVQ